jgi:formylglycine-generating enzyme required for sulfatase activity
MNIIELGILNEKPVKVELVTIPKGSFMMGGNTYKDESPIHQVSFEKPFKMSKNVITQPQFEVVMKYNNSREKDSSLPITNVTWFEAVEFCEKLSELKEIKVSLPSESQWEYACRAGTNTEYYCGDKLLKANKKETNKYIIEPNKWKLHNMYGLVFQWCVDDYHYNYINAPSDGTAWCEKNGFCKCIRGGSSASHSAMWLRSRMRMLSHADSRSFNTGFRIVVNSI